MYSRPTSPKPSLRYVLLPLAVLVGLLAVASPASALTLAAAGDISCPKATAKVYEVDPDQPFPDGAPLRCQGSRTSKLIEDNDPFAVLALGDLIQGQPSRPGAYRDFEREWGRLGEKIMPTIGNHDYFTRLSGDETADGYFDYWESKGAPSWKVGDRGDGWTSWNVGAWHMINLNSNCRKSGCAFTDAQLTWLLEDLKANRENPDTKCTLAYFHHPLFSAGVPLGRTGASTLLVNIWELLYRYRTDVVLNGHQHFYERYAPQNPDGRADATGIRQFIVGTGGDSTFHVADENGNLAANSKVRARTMGAAFFDLEDGSYSWQFKDLDGEVLDASPSPVACHAPNDGANLRRPRTDRYLRHIQKLRRIDSRIDNALSHLPTVKRKLRTSNSKARAGEDPVPTPAKLRSRVRAIKKKVAAYRLKYEAERVSRLYPKR